MNKKHIIITLFTLATLTFSSCGSSEPEWEDPEAHEKTEQLQKQYVPFIVGTWHYEGIQEKQRVFEQLTFKEGEIVTYLPYSIIALFDKADATTLRFASWWQDSNGWTNYQRGEGTPSF
ncbi:MAG: hypothetical protein IKN15_08345 [Bacteroidaceae bacterium]|nr:hypothetical protein [Bacteroidaceae bacterium]